MPAFNLQLDSTNYTLDIALIRAGIIQNGSGQNINQVTITNKRQEQITFWINFAFEAMPNLTKPNASLYTVAFTNGNNTWRFNINNINFNNIPNNIIPGNSDGSYAKLFSTYSLPSFTPSELHDAVTNVNTYVGDTTQIGDKVLKSLTILLIATNEAIRFSEVENSINNLINCTINKYAPPTEIIHNWGGHGIGI